MMQYSKTKARVQRKYSNFQFVNKHAGEIFLSWL